MQIPCKFASELQRLCFRDSFRVLASGSKSCDGIARMTMQIRRKFESDLRRLCFRDSFRVLASGSKSCDGIARMTMQIRRKFERELRGNLAIPSQFRRNSIASCYIFFKKKFKYKTIEHKCEILSNQIHFQIHFHCLCFQPHRL